MALLTNINGKFSVSDAGAVTFNNAFTFPTADGTANYVLKTNGSGQLSWAPDSDSGTVKGTGAATRVAFWSASDTISSSDDLYWDNTNKRLGIGVATPAALLETCDGMHCYICLIDLRFARRRCGRTLPRVSIADNICCCCVCYNVSNPAGR